MESRPLILLDRRAAFFPQSLVGSWRRSHSKRVTPEAMETTVKARPPGPAPTAAQFRCTRRTIWKISFEANIVVKLSAG
jgi:hypothetical protein